jgi:hypothetical protein
VEPCFSMLLYVPSPDHRLVGLCLLVKEVRVVQISDHRLGSGSSDTTIASSRSAPVKTAPVRAVQQTRPLEHMKKWSQCRALEAFRVFKSRPSAVYHTGEANNMLDGSIFGTNGVFPYAQQNHFIYSLPQFIRVFIST